MELNNGRLAADQPRMMFPVSAALLWELQGSGIDFEQIGGG
jgi:hypothetical protein